MYCTSFFFNSKKILRKTSNSIKTTKVCNLFGLTTQKKKKISYLTIKNIFVLQNHLQPEKSSSNCFLQLITGENFVVFLKKQWVNILSVVKLKIK